MPGILIARTENHYTAIFTTADTSDEAQAGGDGATDDEVINFITINKDSPALKVLIALIRLEQETAVSAVEDLMTSIFEAGRESVAR